MLTNTQLSTDILEHRISANSKNGLSRDVKQCCPFLTRVRYYKTQSLKDKKIFSILNSGDVEKKSKVNEEINENAGTSMMYYL